ncbi:dihydroxyacetone kinase subunit DhaL [Denitrobaculum tricleocarpae]|uniref:Dihydroxyacetone kinase subunit L n=1 Tax=Denitrobaculum tricleocarpae TaxID=2591009 RepID=A0A545TEM6_9PROT|nr:dihydroxyacetone kinase subunit DhaL [Denitrobaculum tricleocarpae]TQV75678.1 dihydroxyacetone kinase subunit L [Denitrobaculum tricleocarpae]
MEPETIKALIRRTHEVILAHAEELTDLDQAIGDGDHGINMKRGFDAIAAAADAIAELPCGKALEKAGMTLVMSVGGASGPLYGSLLMAMGKAMPEAPDSVGDIAKAFQAGVEAVMKRGKSEGGEKTMLEVLLPVATSLKDAGALDIGVLRKTADAGLASTKDMKATKGRASFLGERSIGHLDPGARSSALLIHAVCDVIEGK